MASKIASLLLLLSATASAQRCAIQFDGRVPKGSTPDTFDTPASKYNPDNVFGAGLSWSQIIQFPTVPPTIFDKNISVPIEVTISDASIFNNQTGFRRAELLPASNNGSDPSTIGVKTLHFSLRRDPARELNYTHEYQLVFLESADFSTNQFVLKTGTIIGREGEDGERLILQSNVKAVTDLHVVPFTENVWHNYALTLDFNNNSTQVFYSQDNATLVPATDALPNDVSGRGQYHFGLLKKPTGEGLTDITKEGFQEAGITEGILYGGVLLEDSEDGCISLCGA
ncbi:hypothetical protein B0O99DRAFT_687756 [Bisporella sp. PMI_857]|nr:hypothetical protein B0O99DRAFT_687756 [Bisporella sp. PMI_857]